MINLKSSSIRIQRVKPEATWPIRHQVMWPDRNLNYVKLPNDSEGMHYGLYQGETLLSVVSLFVKDDEAQFRKFATLAKQQGKGLGSQLLEHLIDEAKRQGVKRLWCNARVDKTGFYERFGMTTTNQTFSKGGIDYVIMEVFP